MRKSIENICSEFSDSYLFKTGAKREIVSLKIHPDALEDLAQVLSHYEFELASVNVLSFYSILTIFVKEKKTASIEDHLFPSGVAFS